MNARSTIEETTEEPTRPVTSVASRELVRWARVHRLSEIAIERLLYAPDADAITSAVAELVEIRAIAGGEIQ